MLSTKWVSVSLRDSRDITGEEKETLQRLETCLLDMTAFELTNFLQQRLSAQDLLKIEPTSVSWWMEEGFLSLHLSLRDSW